MQTPFADKLYTNYIALGPEIKQIHQIIAKPLDDILQLNEKIVHFQAIIDDLSRERDKLSKFVEDHRALLSGARRLPHELVQQIFFDCLPTDRNSVMSSDEAPVLLGRICKLWRQISLSTPQLWSSLHVPALNPTFLVKHGRGKLLQRAEAVKGWLGLSGSCPLSLSFVFQPGMILEEDAESHFAAKHLLQTIILFSQRWKDVDFSLTSSVLDQCLSTLAGTDVPVLERIRFQPFHDQETPPPVQKWVSAPMFRVPSLRHVTLMSADCISSDSVLPWGCLTHLSLTSDGWGRRMLSSTKALEILNQCSRLISCSMEIDVSQDRRSTYASTVSLPSLHSLEINISEEEEEQNNAILRGFFEALSLPSLQHFKYSGYDFVQHAADLPFKSLLTQSRTHGIESFELGLVTVSRSGLVLDCLPLLPSLKRLTLVERPAFTWWNPNVDDAILCDDLLTLLTPRAGVEYLCPGLEEISLEQCTKITEEAICRFLTWRTRLELVHPMAVRLKRAKFSFLRHPVIDVIPQLTPLIAEGLQICLDYLPPVRR
jgi:F-box-like